METEDGLLINAHSSVPPGPSQHPKGWKTRSKPQRRGEEKKTVKRKLEQPQEVVPLKRKSVSPSPQTKQLPKKPKSGLKISGQPTPPSKKPLTDANGGSRPFVKTSSLFKNNPEIPDIQRTSVKQVQEKIFTSDSFDQLKLHPHLVSTITSVLKISNMTSVQKQTIPVLLEGRDALVRSQTGSGKTLAYGVPLVQSLQRAEPKIQRSDGPYALVLVPTRELALQSFETIQKLLKPFAWIVPGVLMGGEKKKSEKSRIRKGINILIATPGRLVDHINSTKCLHFHRVRWLILDEADRILDLGFEKAVTAILNAVNAGGEKRQNVLLSATLTEGVSRLADISLQNPVSISMAGESQGSDGAHLRVTAREGDVGPPTGVEGEGFAVPEELQQNVVVVPSKLRLVTLAAFVLGKFKFEKRNKMVVFFSSCEQVDFHHALFRKVLDGDPEPGGPKQSQPLSSPLALLRLHGDMKQEERTSVFQDFLRSKEGVLFCTDVAARGLDLPRVTWIVQYNPPASLAEYVHRIGRTARIGSRGNSLLVLTPSEAEYVTFLASHKINSVLEMKMESVLSSLMKDDRFVGSHWRNKNAHSADPQEAHRRATVLQTEFENYVHSSPEMVQWAKKALQSFIRSYATYPASLKHIFHIRSLHLGHVAKSFGLRDAPRNLRDSTIPDRRKKQKRHDVLKKPHGKGRLAKMLQSEYSSGLDRAPSKVKWKKKVAKDRIQGTPS
nr:probable ATP-dependent RNA helicase DDX31 isoform X1 [Pogona vitticeps]XP_020650504.1 probable ATP-dependent RNA helicase DDX31 isoform X1 [Pogona vitticeps]